MTNEIEIISIEKFFFFAMLILIAYLWGYRKYRVDRIRDKLFVLREELFLRTMDLNVPFSDPVYIETRSAINAFLRYGHKLNTWWMFAMFLFSSRDDDRIPDSLETADISTEYKEFIEDIRYRCLWTIFLHIISGSPPLFIIFLFQVSIILFKMILEKVVQIAMSDDRRTSFAPIGGASTLISVVQRMESREVYR